MVGDILLNGLYVLESFDHERITNDCGNFKEDYCSSNSIQLTRFHDLLLEIRLHEVADLSKNYLFGESRCWQTGPIIDFVTLVKLISCSYATILSDLAKAIVKHVDKVCQAYHGITSALLRYYM